MLLALNKFTWKQNKLRRTYNEMFCAWENRDGDYVEGYFKGSGQEAQLTYVGKETEFVDKFIRMCKMLGVTPERPDIIEPEVIRAKVREDWALSVPTPPRPREQDSNPKPEGWYRLELKHFEMKIEAEVQRRIEEMKAQTAVAQKAEGVK